MELARACSAAVAAMQGDAGPLALSSAHYIRPDGDTPVHPCMQHKKEKTTPVGVSQ